MTIEQENKIIEQAQDILERRFAVGHELTLNTQSVAYYSAYYLGAILAVRKVVVDLLVSKPKGDDWIYLEAFWNCITKDKRHMQMYMDGEERKKELMEKNIRIAMTGEMDQIPADTAKVLNSAIEETKHNTGMVLNFAMNYGSQREMVLAARKYTEEEINGKRANDQ